MVPSCVKNLDILLLLRAKNSDLLDFLNDSNNLETIYTSTQTLLEKVGGVTDDTSAEIVREINTQVAEMAILAAVIEILISRLENNPTHKISKLLGSKKLKEWRTIAVLLNSAAGKAAATAAMYNARQGNWDKAISNGFALVAASFTILSHNAKETGIHTPGHDIIPIILNLTSIFIDKCVEQFQAIVTDALEWIANEMEEIRDSLTDTFEWTDGKITGIKKDFNESVNNMLNIFKNSKTLKELVVDDILVLNDALLDSLQVRNKELLKNFKNYNGDKPLILGSIILDNFQTGVIKGNTADALAYRYALLHLNQFTIPGEHFYTKTFLGKEYDYLMLADKNNPATYSGMTEEYLKNRVAMLSTMKYGDSTGENERTTFVDKASNIEWINSPIPFDSKRVVFGSNSDDKGENGGLKGSPKDNDALFGAAGDDELESGDGSDYMEGGVGYDTYILSSKDKGIDTIFDIDGKGVLEVDGQKLNNLEFKPLGIPDSSKTLLHR